MGSIETQATATRPVVHVHGGEDLANRVAKLGWDVVRVEAAAADSARAKGLALISDESSSWGDDRLSAAVCEAVIKQSVDQLSALRADAKKTTHDARNSVGLIWLHLAALERATGNATSGPSTEVKDAVEQIKEETRAIVALLDRLNTAARG